MLYVGPDQIIPFSGAVGTIIGLLLIFWGKVLQVVRKFYGLFSSKPAVEDEPRT